MTSRTTQCHCGSMALRCEGEPSKISMCHCLDCQRRTGSVFSIAAFYSRESVHCEKGAASKFTRDSASGFPVTFYFCPRCGSNLYWEPARLPHLIGMAVGGFSDPRFPLPDQAVWTKDMHCWLVLPDGIKTVDTNPTPRPT
jgi:hypothetical protein